MNLLLEWALTSSVLIVVVLALRVLLRGRVSLRLQYAMWAVVLARLLFPFQLPLPAPVSASELAPQVSGLDQPSIPVLPVIWSLEEIQDGQAPDVWMGSGGELETANSSGMVQPVGEDQAAYALLWLSPEQVVLILWGAGAAITALVLLGANLRFSIRLRRSRRAFPIQNAAVPAYITECICSPCLFGLFRPAVYLTPESAADEQMRRHVLAHELTHFAHRDHIWAVLRCLALVLHWYNPLVWAAAYLSRQDGELACDEGAIRRLGEEERIPYGRTLVSLVARRGPRPRDVLTCSTTMAQGSRGIRQRIIRLVKRPHTVKTALFLAASALALAAVVSFVKPPEIHSYRDFLQALENSDNIRNFRRALPVYRPDRMEEIHALLSSGQETSDSLQPSPDHGGACPLYWLTVKDWKETPSFYLCNCAGEDRLWVSTGPVSWQSLAVFPDGTAQHLEELTDVRFLTLEDIQQQLGQADTVYLAASPLSSGIPNATLTDPQLLEELRALFAQGEPSPRASVYYHEAHLPAWNARLSLLPPQQWGEQPWDQLLFLEEEDGCQVLTLMRWEDQWYDNVAVLPSGSSQTIADLIARQAARG